MPAENIQFKLPSYEEMIKSGMHLGRKKSAFNAKMKPWVHAVRDQLHIIDLVKTGEALNEAILEMKKLLEDPNKLILFVATTPQSTEAIKNISADLDMPYILDRWLGGTFTNFKTIQSRVRHLEQLEEEKATTGFEKYTKLEALMKTREIEKLKGKFEGLKKMTRIPDMVFVSSVRESMIAVEEAKKTEVKLVGIINTDSDPMDIDFPIPANDNSKQSVELIISTIHQELKK